MDGLEFLVRFFLLELHVLQGGKRSSHLLGVVSFLILGCSLLALVGVVVVLPSSLYAVFHPFRVGTHQDYLFVACLLNLKA